MMSLGLVVAAALAVWTIAGRAVGKDEKTHDWPAHAGDNGSTKYSTLDQINKETIKNLRIAWRQSSVPDELKASFPGAQGNTNWQIRKCFGHRPNPGHLLI